MRYEASQDDMRQYADLLRRIGILDLQAQQIADQRNQVVQAIAQWEKEHERPDLEPTMEVPADDPDLEKVGLPA